ncbi:MAG TPA: YidC/Oxa1 family membrane protein insertase [Acidimicrobiia bacterium]|nr:YidC/Oxa1 family membrane protein insertase [Acidimicrobiia bacterium]
MSQLFTNITHGMGAVLAFLYSIIPSYGLAIIGLTVLVRLVLFPMTAKQARSMQKMQQIQPEIKKLQAKYKDNRQQLNEEIMKFYKENKVNPMAGCLPLVLQLPIFWALYRVLEFPLKNIPADSKLFHAFCGDLAAKACGTAPNHPKNLPFLSLDLSKAASNIVGGFGTSLPYYLLIALVVITGYVQFKQTQARQASQPNSQANAQAAMMGKIFPAVFAFISYRLPSGVVLYFLVSNLWQIGQQALIFRTPPEPIVGGASAAAAGTVPATGSAPRPSGKGGGGAKPKDQTPEPQPQPEGRFKRALSQAREAAQAKGGPAGGNGGPAKPPPKNPSPGGGTGRASGEGVSGRAQPSGSKPRPKKRPR